MAVYCSTAVYWSTDVPTAVYWSTDVPTARLWPLALSLPG